MAYLAHLVEPISPCLTCKDVQECTNKFSCDLYISYRRKVDNYQIAEAIRRQRKHSSNKYDPRYA